MTKTRAIAHFLDAADNDFGERRPARQSPAERTRGRASVPSIELAAARAKLA